MNISIKFLASINESAKSGFSAEVMERARKSFLDYLAVTCAGAEFQRDKLNKYNAFAEPEEGRFKTVGTGRTLALKEAVFLNGLNSHALDYDDGTNSGIIHLGSPIFSLLLPLAQKYGNTIEEVLKAAIIGYEVSYTMAVSIQPGHKALGYHATGTCGVLGATLAAAYMLGLSEEERFQAFATACVSATGMLNVFDDGSELKPYNVAKTALLSLLSIQLAKSGFKGPPDPLGGKRGYLKMMTGKENVELKPTLLDGTYAIMKSYTKLYASCRYTHPAVEAAIHLKNLYGLKAKDVKTITVRTYELAIHGHDHTDILGPYSAKMSIPYSTAVGFIYGRAGLQEFSGEYINDTEIQELTKKILVISDEEISREFPRIQAAVVIVKTDNDTYMDRVDFPKGEPENPLTDEEFRERYDTLMHYGGVTEDDSCKIFNMIYKPKTVVSDVLKIV